MKIVVIILIISVTGTIQPKEAQAMPVVEVGKNLIVNSMAAAKDVGLFGTISGDGMAWAAINIMVEKMLQSTIAWVNSGFQGKPAFVEDFNKFLLDIGDQYFFAFVGGNLQALCSPFKLNIQLALKEQYYAGRDGYAPTCRLSTAIKNHEGFLNGDFVGGGGWDAFYDIAFTPELNPMGALAESEAALRFGIRNAKEQNLFEVGVVGQGFLSKRDCDANGANCKIVTPGQTIQGYLGDTLAAPIHRMTVADEIDELLASLVTQLAGRILGGSGGLRGASSGGGTGEGRYLGTTPASDREQFIDNAALEQYVQENEQSASVQGSGDGLLNDYTTLLNDAIDLLESCNESRLTRSQKNELDAKTNELTGELIDARTGDTEVTDSLIATFVREELPQVRSLVSSMPDRASCTI